MLMPSAKITNTSTVLILLCLVILRNAIKDTITEITVKAMLCLIFALFTLMLYFHITNAGGEQKLLHRCFFYQIQNKKSASRKGFSINATSLAGSYGYTNN